MNPPTSPVKYHVENHSPPIPFGDCWRCARARAICQSKRTYDTREAADTAVKTVNEAESYRQPVVRYRCRWCLLWHLTTARTKPRARRAEKQRRRWLVSSRSQWEETG